MVLACNAGKAVVEEEYASAADAARANALERGLVPSWMPQAATDLRITADLDSGVVVLAFSVPAGFDLTKHLGREELKGSISDRGLRGQAGVDAWPQCARTPDESCNGYRYFVLEGDQATPRSYVAEDTADDRVYWLHR